MHSQSEKPPADQHCDPAEFWNDRYSQSEQIWTGKVNASLVDALSNLPTGTSLDLGCGEGGDVLWLAQQGWNATGIDISTVAIARAQARAAAEGLEHRAHFVAGDLHDPDTHRQLANEFTLVTASFFQSPVHLDRIRAISAAAAMLKPGGHLVLISHASRPSWANGEHTGPPNLIQPSDEITNLQLDTAQWELLRTELVTREITGPEGQVGTIDDTVVVAGKK